MVKNNKPNAMVEIITSALLFSNITNCSGINLSSATLVYADFTREVFKNSSGITKIRYFNESDVTVIADLTD